MKASIFVAAALVLAASSSANVVPERRLVDTLKPPLQKGTASLKPVVGGITPGLPLENAKQQDPLGVQQVAVTDGQLNPLGGLVKTIGLRDVAPEKRLVDTLKPVLAGVTAPLKPVLSGVLNGLPLDNAEQQDPLGLQQVLVVDGQLNPLGGLVKTLGLRDSPSAEKRLVDTLKPVLAPVTAPLKPVVGGITPALPLENAKQQDPLGLQQVAVVDGQLNPLGGLVKTIGLRDVAPEKRLIDVLEPVLKAVTNPVDKLVPALQAGQVVHNILGVVEDLIPEKYAPAPRAEKPKTCIASDKVVQSFKLPEKVAKKYTHAYVCKTFTKACSTQKHDKDVESLAATCTFNKRSAKLTTIKASCVLSQKHGKSYSLTARAAAAALDKLDGKPKKAVVKTGEKAAVKTAKIARVEICK